MSGQDLPEIVLEVGTGPAGLLTLEQRLLMALSRRGSLRIGQFISNALNRCRTVFDDIDGPVGVEHDCAQGVPDREFVAAVETYADALGETKC